MPSSFSHCHRSTPKRKTRFPLHQNTTHSASCSIADTAVLSWFHPMPFSAFVALPSHIMQFRSSKPARISLYSTHPCRTPSSRYSSFGFIGSYHPDGTDRERLFDRVAHPFLDSLFVACAVFRFHGIARTLFLFGSVLARLVAILPRSTSRFLAQHVHLNGALFDALRRFVIAIASDRRGSNSNTPHIIARPNTTKRDFS